MASVDLTGRTAIVTGAGRGICRAMAIQLAELRANVVVVDTGTTFTGVGNDRSVADAVANQIVADGGRAVGCAESVATLEGAESIVVAALDAFGGLDIVVNGAGITRQNMVWDMPEADFDAVVGTHLKGAWNTTKAAAPTLMAQRSGSIINISSGVSVTGAVAVCNYAAAKAGMLGLTFGTALDLGPFGIRVNAVFPAGWSRLFDKPEPWRDRYPTEPRPTMSAEDWPTEAVAPLVSFLASDHAGDVNGQLFTAGADSVGVFGTWSVMREIRSDGSMFSPDELARRLPGELLADVANPSPRQDDDGRCWPWTRRGGLTPAHDPEQRPRRGGTTST